MLCKFFFDNSVVQLFLLVKLIVFLLWQRSYYTPRSRPHEDRGGRAQQQQRRHRYQIVDGPAGGGVPAAVEVPVAVVAAVGSGSDALQHVEVAPEGRVSAPAVEREADVGGGGVVVEAEAGHDAVDAAEHELRLRQARPAAEGVGRPRRHVQRALRAQPERALAPAVDLIFFTRSWQKTLHVQYARTPYDHYYNSEIKAQNCNKYIRDECV